MKIREINCDGVFFDNNSQIRGYHSQDCCEDVYADFEYLRDETELEDYDFEETIEFENVPHAGFRFGDSRRKFFVPCYNIQNGYYSDELTIEYYDKDDHLVTSFEAEKEDQIY